MSTETETEIANVVNFEFNKEGGHRDAILEDFQNEMNKLIVRFMAGFGLALVTFGVTFTFFLSGISKDVESLNDFASSGNRFTSEQAEILRFQILTNKEAVANSAASEDVRELKEAFIRLDERLQKKGI